LSHAAHSLSRLHMPFVIRPTPPFDFQRSAQMHSRFKNSLPDLYEDGVYMRVLRANRKPALVSISSMGTIEEPKLLIDAYPSLNKHEVLQLKRLLRSMFEPTFDFEHFYAIAKKDAIMRTIAKQLRGLRPIRPPTIFESAIIAITEQQISLHAAAAIRSRLIQKYGDTVMRNERTFYGFPTPGSLARAKLAGLRRTGLSATKARCISEFSKRIADDGFDLEGLRRMDDDQVVTELTKFWGIGKWTAEYVLVRGMGHVNSLPADDLGIRRAVSQAYFNGRSISAEQVRKIMMEKFAPYGGISAFYLMYHLFWEPSNS
jgi:DNA-3-methyladenine glycosylase II